MPQRRSVALVAGALVVVVAGCSPSPSSSPTLASTPTVASSPLAAPGPSSSAPATPTPTVSAASAMPSFDPTDLYAADRPGMLAPQARTARPLIYAPDTDDATVHVIDPATYKVIDVLEVGRQPQHVVPSYDLSTLWVANDQGNSLTPIDPRTGTTETPVPVDDPYNMYFTADGRSAVVVAEAKRKLDFRDPRTMKLQSSFPVPCKGIDHADYSPDGTHALFSCEFSGQLLWIDMQARTVEKTIDLPARSGGRMPMPQDVKISPDGSTFYVADMASNGVWLIDAGALTVRSFVPTGDGAHGLYVSRDSLDLYISNRTGHSVSVLSFATGTLRARWPIPNGSPDMGGVSADGKVLWLSGRYDREVYALSTTDGKLLARIPVGGGPHGLAVWPQPGRFSLRHTGILR